MNRIGFFKLIRGMARSVIFNFSKVENSQLFQELYAVSLIFSALGVPRALFYQTICRVSNLWITVTSMSPSPQPFPREVTVPLPAAPGSFTT